MSATAVREVNFTANGMTDLEISGLNAVFGRKTNEYSDTVEIRVDSGYLGIGGFIIKIKEERYYNRPLWPYAEDGFDGDSE